MNIKRCYRGSHAVGHKTLTTDQIIECTMTMPPVLGYIILLLSCPLLVMNVYYLLFEACFYGYTLSLACIHIFSSAVPVIIAICIVIPDAQTRKRIREGDFSLQVVYEGSLCIDKGEVIGNTRSCYAVIIHGKMLILSGYYCDEYELSDELMTKLVKGKEHF